MEKNLLLLIGLVIVLSVYLSILLIVNTPSCQQVPVPIETCQQVPYIVEECKQVEITEPVCRLISESVEECHQEDYSYKVSGKTDPTYTYRCFWDETPGTWLGDWHSAWAWVENFEEEAGTFEVTLWLTNENDVPYEKKSESKFIPAKGLAEFRQDWEVGDVKTCFVTVTPPQKRVCENVVKPIRKCEDETRYKEECKPITKYEQRCSTTTVYEERCS